MGVARIRTDDEANSAFDRFITKMKAEAWDECASVARGDVETELAEANPYREGENSD